MQELPADDSGKISRLRQSQSSGATRLQSFQLPKYSRQPETPPTRLSVSTNEDVPELLLMDTLRSRLTIGKFVHVWRVKALHRRQRRSAFQESLGRPDFDIEPRIDTITDARDKLVLQKTMRALKAEHNLEKEAATAGEILRRRILCRAFGRWESEVIKSLVKHTERRRMKVESHANARAPDLLGRLHSLITRRAELETALENSQREITDINSVICDRKKQIQAINDQIEDEQSENDRIQEMKAGIDNEYKDQIATLRMMLSKECDRRQEQIEVAKQRLKLQRKAKQMTSETIGESKEALQNKLGSIREKLASAQSIAVQIRDELIQSEDEQTDIANEMAAMKAEIAKLTYECEDLKRRREESNSMIGGNLDQLKKQYQDVLKEVNKAKKVIEQYNDELLDQDGRIDILTRELALARQRRRTAIDAFTQDGPETF